MRGKHAIEILALAARDKTSCARDCIAASHDSTDVESGEGLTVCAATQLSDSNPPSLPTSQRAR